MIELHHYIHYITVALAAGINAIGVGLGEGTTGSAALKAINTQPVATNDIIKTAVIGMAIVETAAILGFTVATLLIFDTHFAHPTAFSGIAEIGIGLAICLPGFFIGIVSALPAHYACVSLARQPFFGKNILRFMLISQALLQTPLIAGFIIAIAIKSQTTLGTTWYDSLRLLASGLCMGLGSIGPSLGLGIYARTACSMVGINRAVFGKLFSFTLLSQALIETSVIFSLVIALLIIFAHSTTMTQSIALLAAAVCTGLGTFGAGIGSGKTAAAACMQITTIPEEMPTISRMSMIAQGLMDTCAIYALIISIMLIFFH